MIDHWDYDRSIGDGTGHDVASPLGGGSQVQWSADSRKIYFVSADEGQTRLMWVPIDGGPVQTVTPFDQGDLSSFTISLDGQVAAIFSAPDQPFDLYTFALNKPGLENWQRHTNLNEEVLAKTKLSTYEEIWYKSFDKRRIQGWILKPPSFEPEHKYPLILYIHGGPHGMYGTTFFHEFQVLANAGYVVLITNPRGSTGYGSDFGNIIQYRYPGDDYRDLMIGVDKLIERGYVDEARMGVAGGSGGGLLTTWIVGHTNRFAAAVAQRNVTNWYSFVGTSDFNYYFTQRWFRGFPWEHRENYRERSPLTYVGNVQTPVLLIHSDKDYRTPLEQSLQYYTSLKMQKKVAKLVIFPNESHGLSRGGSPSHRIARINHIREWFDTYLKSKPVE